MKLRQIIAFFFLTVVLTGCQHSSSPQERPSVHEQPLKVVVSILPQKEFVEKIAGDFVDVYVLIPPGSSPETYNLAPQDSIVLAQASVYFHLGQLPFEHSSLPRIRSLYPQLRLVDTSERITLRTFTDHEIERDAEGDDESEEGENERGSGMHQHHHGTVDPHIWLSPRNVMIMADTITSVLSEMYPAQAEYFTKRAEEYKLSLAQLHSDLQKRIQNLPSRKMMVFHPAWGYFADEFGLEQIAIEQDGNEPTPVQLRKLIEQARKDDIGFIFVQKQFSTASAQNIADEIGASVIPIDPLAEAYIDNLSAIGTILESHSMRQ